MAKEMRKRYLVEILIGFIVCGAVATILHSSKPLAERLQTATGSFVLLCVNADEKTIAEGQHLTVYPTHGYGDVLHPYISAGDHCATMGVQAEGGCYRVVAGTAVTELWVVYPTPTGGRGYRSVPRNPIGERQVNSGEFEWCAVSRPDNVPIFHIGYVRKGMPLLPPDAE